ncbi:allatostatins [Cimex lectularius]|uniref:Allatostatin A n=1 Tax=Cimex lectularius TaxID=79782 RepID=A0A8I6S957_CIMLE|nr:allatostatins [Cimex lectularius]
MLLYKGVWLDPPPQCIYLRRTYRRIFLLTIVLVSWTRSQAKTIIMMLIPCFATLLFLFELSGKRGVNAETDKDLHDICKRLYDFGLGKRAAYSYVSEYKRLPVYNFGLGKRAAGEKTYSFGLGKRDYDMDEEYDDEMRDDFNKRGRQYAFGLGKRLPKQYSFGLGKRPEGKMYSFGLGKRSQMAESDDYDSIENGRGMEEKRTKSGKDLRYMFGIGKRDVDEDERARQERSMHYNFGLGKRIANMQEKDTTQSALVN